MCLGCLDCPGLCFFKGGQGPSNFLEVLELFRFCVCSCFEVFCSVCRLCLLGSEDVYRCGEF